MHTPNSASAKTPRASAKTGKTLVTGATGMVGRHTVAALLERGADVRAASRHPDAAREQFGEGVECVRFDYADAGSFAEALRDVTQVMLIVPPVRLDVAELTAPFIDYLAEHGPAHVVHLSAYGAEQLPSYAPVVERVRAAGFALTTLEPGFFATNYGVYDRAAIEERDVVFQPAGEGRTAYVNPADVGRAAAAVLTGDGHVGKTYRLTGPELHAIAEIAGLIGEVRGRPVQYVSPSPEGYAAAMAEAGVPDFVVAYMQPLYRLIRENEVAEVTGDVERLTGRAPMRLREQLAADFGGRQ